ncbi:MAG: alpha/beta hydrolase [Pseudomonadota bacterium]
MPITYQKRYLDTQDIRDAWKILNPLLGSLNKERVYYTICSQPDYANRKEAVFYLHGLGSDITACPEIDQVICAETHLIRVSCFGVSGSMKPILAATFGDVCAMLYNGRQSIYTIADLLRLDSYSIVAHSWGGFIACLAALNDPRCRKAMLLVSTPDICDALSRMYHHMGLPEFGTPVFDIFMGKLRVDAEKAKTGRSWHQKAWNAISPYEEIGNPKIKMLIFNRNEDVVMRRANVEHFLDHARKRGIYGIHAEFLTRPDLPDPHDMPPEAFLQRMRTFLFTD